MDPVTETGERRLYPPDRAEGSFTGQHRYRGMLVRAGAGAILVAFLIAHSGADAIVSLLPRERPAYFAAATVLYVAGQVMSAYRWQLLAALVSIRGPFREFLAYYFVGVFTNLFVPGLVGGDAARALYLGRRPERLGAAAASAIADRAVGLMAMFWFAGAAASLVHRGTLPPAVTRPAIAVGIIALAGYVAAPLAARFIRLAPLRVGRYIGLITPYLERRRSLVPSIMLSLILQTSLVICQYLLALGMGLPISFSLLLLCVPIANMFASLPVTLNGLGVREGTYVVLFAMAGIGRADAVALGLVWFVSTMVGGLTGIIPFLALEAPGFRASGTGSDAR